MQHQQQQQQQQQQRNSFFRANRPGNLNLIDIDSETMAAPVSMSAGGSQPMQLSQHSYTPTHAPPTNNYGGALGSATYQTQASVPSPYITAPNQPPQTPSQPYIHTPSYATTAPNKPNYSYEQQSYTPKYSPCAPSSAQIINKHTQYFNFDVNNVNTMNGAPQQQHQQQPQQQQQFGMPQSQNNSLGVLASPRYLSHTQNTGAGQSMYNQGQFGANSFHTKTQQSTNNAPMTPISALPYMHNHQSNHHLGHTTTTGSAHHTSLSVPNSPLHHQAHLRNSNNQHSVFQFNTSLNNSLQTTLLQQQQQQKTLANTGSNNNNSNNNNNNHTPSYQHSFFPPPSSDSNGATTTHLTTSSYNNNNNVDGQANKQQLTNDLILDDVVASDPYELINTNHDLDLTDDVTNDHHHKKATNLVVGLGDSLVSDAVVSTTAPQVGRLGTSLQDDTSQQVTYGENDVDMVQQVIEDMMQKEEINNNNNNSNGNNSGNNKVVDVSSSSPVGNSSADDFMLGDGKSASLQQQSPLNLVSQSTNSSSVSHLLASTSSPAVSSSSKVANQMLTSTPIVIEPTPPNGGMKFGQSQFLPDDDKELKMTSGDAVSIDIKQILNDSARSTATDHHHRAGKKNNLDSLTSVANILLNPNVVEPNVAESAKPLSSSCSLSNLSEAASAAFLLDYAEETPASLQQEHHAAPKNANKSLKVNKMDIAPAYSPYNYTNSPGSSSATSYGKKVNTTKDINYKFNVASPLNVNPNDLNGPGPNGAGNSLTCTDCGKDFSNKSALAKHRLIHSNERKYSCTLCDKSFKRQDHLNGHMMTHQEKKPFECKAPGCDKSYCDSRSLKRHVESQHQDYLALLANGNKEALNYLPSIGKIKANIAPNVHQEIIVKSTQNNDHHDPNQQQYSPITPVIFNVEEAKASLTGQKKNFFTFEEPKPEKCKICGKGFKNIPALNGHMRLHGGYLKQKAGGRGPNDSQAGDDLNTSANNDDSMSSNCSSSNSFSSTLSSTNRFAQNALASNTAANKHSLAHSSSTSNLMSYETNTSTNQLRLNTNQLVADDYANSSTSSLSTMLDSSHHAKKPPKSQSNVHNRMSNNTQHMLFNEDKYPKKSSYVQLHTGDMNDSTTTTTNSTSNAYNTSINASKSLVKKEFTSPTNENLPMANFYNQNLNQNFNSMFGINTSSSHQYTSQNYQSNPMISNYHPDNGQQQKNNQIINPNAVNSFNVNVNNSMSRKSNKINKTMSSELADPAAETTTTTTTSSSSSSPPKFISNILQKQLQQQHVNLTASDPYRSNMNMNMNMNTTQQLNSNEPDNYPNPVKSQHSHTHSYPHHVHQPAHSMQQQHQHQQQPQQHHHVTHSQQNTPQMQSNWFVKPSNAIPNHQSSSFADSSKNFDYNNLNSLNKSEGYVSNNGSNNSSTNANVSSSSSAMESMSSGQTNLFGAPSGGSTSLPTHSSLQNLIESNQHHSSNGPNYSHELINMRKKSQDLSNANNNSNQTDDNQHNTNQQNLNILSQQIIDITKVILNQPNSTLSATMAVAVAAAAAATASNNNNTSTSQQQQQQQQMNDNLAHQQQSQTKSKSKPMPLVIPSDISAFQQQNQYQKQLIGQRTGSNIPYNHQASSCSQQAYSHFYPNATLLKSPRLLNLENSNKKQYTPPPMLSPFRKGHGLFYNQKGIANLFSLPPLPSHHMGPNGLLKSISYNHPLPCAYYYPQSGPSMLNSSLSYYPFGSSFPKPMANNHYNHHQHQQQQQHVCDQLDHQETNEYDENEQQSMTSRKRMKLADDGTYAKRTTPCTEKENVETTLPTALDKQNDHDEQKETKQILNDNMVENKQPEVDEDNCAEKENQALKEETERIIVDSLLPPSDYAQADEYNKKLLNQNGTFFPDEEGELSNEVIAAALIECAEINKKPFINEGEEYQAVLTEFIKPEDRNAEKDFGESKEDLMWSHEIMDSISDEQFKNYLELICNSPLVCGSSNNLELGLHILYYFRGDFGSAIRAFLDDTVDLPADHPISTYKYSETDIWSQNEIKQFETAILKSDKVFFKIAEQIKTKNFKQCIEFYYLWKKVMSDGMKKKWKNLKKSRNSNDMDTIEQNLRSRSSKNQTSNDETAVVDGVEPSNEPNSQSSDLNDNDDLDGENELDNENDLDDISDDIDLNTTTPGLNNNTKVSTRNNRQINGRYSSPSPNKEFKCQLCNQSFKTKNKLNQHKKSHNIPNE